MAKASINGRARRTGSTRRPYTAVGTGGNRARSASSGQNAGVGAKRSGLKNDEYDPNNFFSIMAHIEQKKASYNEPDHDVYKNNKSNKSLLNRAEPPKRDHKRYGTKPRATSSYHRKTSSNPGHSASMKIRSLGSYAEDSDLAGMADEETALKERLLRECVSSITQRESVECDQQDKNVIMSRLKAFMKDLLVPRDAAETAAGPLDAPAALRVTRDEGQSASLGLKALNHVGGRPETGK